MPKLKEIGLIVENVNARDYVSQAQIAEELGFDRFWVPEDYAFPGAFSSCAAIAAATSKIKIGTGVINPFTRHPVLIAEMWRADAGAGNARGASGRAEDPPPRGPTGRAGRRASAARGVLGVVVIVPSGGALPGPGRRPPET